MKLLHKTVIIIIASFLCLLASSLAFYYLYVLKEFLRVEHDSVRRDTSRAYEAIIAEKEQLRVTAIDWAQWDDMYNYMLKRNSDFEDSWTTYESYKALKICDTLFLNMEKKAVFAIHVNFEEEIVEKSKGNSEIIRDISQNQELFEFSGDIPSKAVFTTINNIPVIAASSPILDSSRSKPPIGYMIIIKKIDSDFIQKISTQTRLPISTADTEIPTGGSEIISILSGSDDANVIIREVSSNLIQAFFSIKNPHNKSLLTLQFDEPRPIYNQGLANLKLFIGFWAIAFVTVVAVSTMLLNRFILSRLERTCLFLQRIGERKDFENRLASEGSDELSILAGDINLTLDSLAEAHTKIKSAQAEAERANAAKSMFIARVSHELRNPIHGIRGINSLISKRAHSKAVKDLVRMGDLVADGLLSIVDEILDFSKAEAGELTFENIPYDLRQVVRETMQVISARLMGKNQHSGKDNIHLICDINPTVPSQLIGDPTRLKQILVNLLSNSVKFTQDGLVGLRISAEPGRNKKTQLQIAVWDTGVGIPADKLDSIFSPFKQVDETISRKYQGTGLGLSIVKQFTEGLGGSVSVKSTPNKGSTFTVLLPQKVAEGETPSLHERLEAKSPSMKALVVANRSLAWEATTRNPSQFDIPLK